MIPLVRGRTATAIPKDFVGGKLTTKHVDLLERYFAAQVSGAPMKFVSSKWKSAKAKVRADSAKKCAYCEAPTSVVAHGDVEHFRPKALYWWLAYDFDNYLFSCQICNQIYKSDDFPVQGARLAAPAMPAAMPATEAAVLALAGQLAIDATTSTDDLVRQRLAAEDADLVHPYFEDPAEIFSYEADDSNEEVWVRPGVHPKSQRAHAASENYLGINREDLRRARYAHYSTIAVLNLVLSGNLSEKMRERIERELSRLSAAKAPFAGMTRYFLGQWGIVI